MNFRIIFPEVRDSLSFLPLRKMPSSIRQKRWLFASFLQSRKYALKVDIRYLFRGNNIYYLSFLGDQPLLPLLLLLLLTDGFYRLASFKARGAHLFISLLRAYAQDVLRSQQVLRSWATLLARSKLRSIPNDTGSINLISSALSNLNFLRSRKQAFWC